MTATDPKSLKSPAPVIPISDWRDGLVTHGNPPRPRATLDNCLTALEFCPVWVDVLGFNEFTHQTYKRRSTPWGSRPGPWTDNDDRLALRWFEQNDILCTPKIATDAIVTHAHRHTINPLLDFLNNLEWDGWHRVDTWLRDYLGVKHTDYSCAVGRAWLISAVARAYQPGCKADHCLILEGPQGKGKSTALRTLAGDDLFSDYMSSDLGSKEASILCIGVWIVEFAELEAIMHKESKVESVKAFLSRVEDRFRPHYAKQAIRVPRQCIFSATTNRDVYMFDDSGNRRFWPVECGRIDLNGLARDREQLWAEAVKLFLDGEEWWLTSEHEALARMEQVKRYETDGWHGIIAPWLIHKKKTDVSIAEVLTECIRREVQSITRSDQFRVVKCLNSLGWKQYRQGKTGERRYRL